MARCLPSHAELSHRHKSNEIPFSSKVEKGKTIPKELLQMRNSTDQVKRGQEDKEKRESKCRKECSPITILSVQSDTVKRPKGLSTP